MIRLFLLLLIVLASVAASEAQSLRPAVQMVSVAPGCFRMGDLFGDGYFNEKPPHEVCLSGYAIGRFAVTRGQFKDFAEQSGYRTDAEKAAGCFVYDGNGWKKQATATWRAPGFPQTDDHPAVCVSWNDAVAFTRWLSEKEGIAYRLPTEAEWEYAARSGGRPERFSGGMDLATVAWYGDNAGDSSHPVGRKQANGLGLYDMSGNVWQWTQDRYGERFYRESPRLDPQGPAAGTNRVLRGGSWFYDISGLRVSYRDFSSPDYCSSQVGFRLAVSLPQPEVRK